MVLTDRVPLADRTRRYLVIAELMRRLGCLPLLPSFQSFLEEEWNWDATLRLPRGSLALERFESGIFDGMAGWEILQHLAIEKSLGTLVSYPILTDGPLDSPEGFSRLVN